MALIHVFPVRHLDPVLLGSCPCTTWVQLQIKWVWSCWWPGQDYSVYSLDVAFRPAACCFHLSEILGMTNFALPEARRTKSFSFNYACTCSSAMHSHLGRSTFMSYSSPLSWGNIIPIFQMGGVRPRAAEKDLEIAEEQGMGFYHQLP